MVAIGAYFNDINGSNSGDTRIFSLSCPTPVYETEPANKIRFYPNPVHGNLNVDLPEGKQSDIRIYNLQGRLMMRKQTSGKSILNLNTLNAGMYLLKVNEMNYKIIKE